MILFSIPTNFNSIIQFIRNLSKITKNKYCIIEDSEVLHGGGTIFLWHHPDNKINLNNDLYFQIDYQTINLSEV